VTERRAAVGRYLSPLRYPGGKAKIANFLKLVLIENDLLGLDYVEPYAGGASVGLALLVEDYASHIHINDINAGVYAFWNSVLTETDALCELIERTPVTVDEWRRQREIHRDPAASGFELAFATFFLNRTNRSGIISGGVIGGLDQTGPWKIDARYNKGELVQRIRKVARFRNRISLTNDDATAMLHSWNVNSGSGAVLYLDPPYYVKGGDLYDNFYSHEDHLLVASLVANLPHPWIVSYDAAPAIIDMYTGEAMQRYAVQYSAATRIYGSEVVFTSANLHVPDIAPASVSNRQVAYAVAGSLFRE